MSKAKETALKFKAACEELGWKYNTTRGILTITKKFNSTNEEFCKADSEYYGLLGLVPSTSAGSIWGTDGGGIGALTAMKSGVFVMNKSGVSKRVMNALDKLC